MSETATKKARINFVCERKRERKSKQMQTNTEKKEIVAEKNPCSCWVPPVICFSIVLRIKQAKKRDDKSKQTPSEREKEKRRKNMLLFQQWFRE